MTVHLAPAAASARHLQSRPTLRPFIKWPGGKSHELPHIASAAPPLGGRLIDPFVGGGSILMATPLEVPVWANDACADLARVYAAAAGPDPAFRGAAEAVAAAWDAFAGLGPLYEGLAQSFRRGEGHPVESVVAGYASMLREVVGRAGPGISVRYLGLVDTDLPAKFERMRRVQSTAGVLLSPSDLLANVEAALRAGLYMAIRWRYNESRRLGRWDAQRSADFLFLREFAYAAMFRFNAKGEFNVPYGGVTYNRKSLTGKVRLMLSRTMQERLAATEWHCLDFEAFLAGAAPERHDFVFVDPPYDSEFSAYDGMPFAWRDHERLRRVLESSPARVMIVIKDSPAVRGLYASGRWRIVESPKTYMWTIKSRNDRSATHLTITNY